MLSIIVAMSRNHVIGRAGGLPWHLSADLKRFRRLTTGHAILMGRKTFDSIGRPLPQRRSIVITRNEAWQSDGVETAANLEEALALAKNGAPESPEENSFDRDEVFVIGGASIYNAALPLADRLYVTHVDAEIDGDVLFPTVDWVAWRALEKSDAERDAASGLDYCFCTYERATEQSAVE